MGGGTGEFCYSGLEELIYDEGMWNIWEPLLAPGGGNERNVELNEVITLLFASFALIRLLLVSDSCLEMASLLTVRVY